eukprot:gene2558-2720_t
MKLIPLQSGDLGLYVKLFTDPIYMADLGGPQPLEKVPKILQKQVDSHTSGAGIVLKIVPEEIDWFTAKEKREKRGLITDEEPFYDFENDLGWKEGIGSVCLWFYEDTPEIGYGVFTKVSKLWLYKSGSFNVIGYSTTRQGKMEYYLCYDCDF